MIVDLRIAGLSVGLALLALAVAFVPLSHNQKPVEANVSERPGAGVQVLVATAPSPDSRLDLVQFNRADLVLVQASVAPPKLTGVAQVDGRRWAYFGSAKGDSQRVGVGDEVEGWKVTALGGSTVTLTLADRSVSLSPFTRARELEATR